MIVLGSTGYVGSKFVNYFHALGHKAMGVSRSEVDYINPETQRSWLKPRNPRFVINSAGYTGKPNVNACELEKA
tara:strand:+ start:5632 stop:5853 length:222 start_codon:yes stop_codon:yes gene_type:complete